VREASALFFGTLVHHGLEAWWQASLRGQPQEHWLTAAMTAMGERDVDELDLAKARVMLTGYHLRWQDEPYEVLSVEQEFLGPLLNPKTRKPSKTWRLAGKLDVVVRDRRDGLVRIIEHKTSAEDVSPGSDYWKKLRLDGQVSVYFEGARILGYEVAELIYDVLAKPRHELSAVPVLDESGAKMVLDATGNRVRTAQGKWRQTGDSTQGFVLQTRPETPEEYALRVATAIAEEPTKWFSRGTVVRLEAELAEAGRDTWELAQALQYDTVQGRFPRNPDACHQPGRVCPYWSICTGEASPDDATQFRSSANVHPELTAAKDAPPEMAP
jgi:hypothetical protein